MEDEQDTPQQSLLPDVQRSSNTRQGKASYPIIHFFHTFHFCVGSNSSFQQLLIRQIYVFLVLLLEDMSIVQRPPKNLPIDKLFSNYFKVVRAASL